MDHFSFWVCVFVVIVLTFLCYIYPWYCRRMAYKAFNSGVYELAANFFLRALKVSPRDAKLWFGYGVSLGRIGRMDDALKALDNVEQFEPFNKEVFSERVAILRLQNRLDFVLEELNQRIRTIGNSDDLRLMRSAVEIELQRYQEAEEDCNYLIEHGSESTSAEAFNNRGVAKLMRGADSDAEADFATSYLLDPRSSLVRAYCAGVWIRHGMPKKALALCDATIKADPSCAAAFYYRGIALQALDRPTEAEESLKRSREIEGSFIRFI